MTAADTTAPAATTQAPNMSLNEADIFEAVADKLATEPCVSFDDEHFTFAEFDALANRMAHAIAAQGFQPAQRVMLLMRNIPEHLAAILALMKLRGAGVNTNYMYRAAEILHLAESAEPVGAIIEAEFSTTFAEMLTLAMEEGASHPFRWVMCVGTPDSSLVAATERAAIPLVDVASALATASDARPDIQRSGDDHWILFTGGTTGVPKGVVWRAADYYYACLSGGNPYGDNRNSIAELVDNANPGMKMLLAAPLMHGAGTFTVFTFLNMGAHVLFQRVFDAENLARAASKHRVLGITIVGDAMGVPLADAIEKLGGELDLSGLFLVASGGGIFSRGVQDRLRSLLGDNVMLRDSVGASESGNDGSMILDDKGRLVMQPMRGIMLVDEMLEPIPSDSREIGFIVRTGHLPVEYLGDAKKSAETFVEINGMRASLLGDMGQFDDDGNIIFLGRGSGVINSGGEKVFPEEVEGVLKQHPAVYDAVVAAAEDQRYGQLVAAVVSLREGVAAPSAEDLRQHVAESLAGYKAPRKVVFVDWVKRSPAGKADYRWAREELAQATS